MIREIRTAAAIQGPPVAPLRPATPGAVLEVVLESGRESVEVVDAAGRTVEGCAAKVGIGVRGSIWGSG